MDIVDCEIPPNTEWNARETLARLSEFEVLELYFIARESVTSDVTIFMTILFAYISVGYLVGSKLSRFQAIAVSALYSFFALYVTYAAYISSQTFGNIIFVMSGEDVWWQAPTTTVLLVVCWISSLVMFIKARDLGDDA